MTTTRKTVPLWMALTPLVFLISGLTLSVMIFGSDSSAGPNQVMLLLAAALAQFFGYRRGLSWAELEKATVHGIGMALNACLVLLAVGALIGSWMLSGTAPALIYFGLAVFDASWFYPAACLICALISISIGSSWTTAGTMGIALIGIADVTGMSLAITAGAVVSGAYFGDKLSPLSDSTNLAPAVVGVDLFVHVRHMMWTTIPSLLISLLLFYLLALTTDITPDQASVEHTRNVLAGLYQIDLVLLLPLVVLITLSVLKMPAYPAILIGAASGVVVALMWQQDSVLRFAADQQWPLLAGAWQAVSTGYQIESGHEMIDKLLSRGGMASMLNTIWLIMCAMTFGAAMEVTGFLQRLVQSIIHLVSGTTSLVTTTVVTAITTNIVAADQYMAIILPGRMFALEFKKRGLAPQNLSRTLEDAGTLTSALVPWNTCGAFMAATLGVATFTYLPFAFLNLINPILAIAWAALDISITRLEPEPTQQGAEKAAA